VRAANASTTPTSSAGAANRGQRDFDAVYTTQTSKPANPIAGR